MLFSDSLPSVIQFFANFVQIFQGPSPSGYDVADTGYAKYVGIQTLPNTVAYLGIPYAEPPLGERRFRAPVPLDTVRITYTQGLNGDVVDATSYPDFCIQGPLGPTPGGAGSEDCLKVNIYTPIGAQLGSNLPVLVFMHGGGFTFGNPRAWPFDHWVEQSPNVVIVSIYYRLSSFGFMSVPEFRDSRLGDFNAGLQDQIEALRWVKRYISRFGGNPDKVTINGQSSGGNSVQLHLLFAGYRENLFRGAIAQSAPRRPLPTPEQQKPAFGIYAEKAGCGTGSIATKLACLRSASISTLARAQEAALGSNFTTSPYKAFQPTLDGVLLTNHPTPALKARHFAKVPFIIGSTTNETLSRELDIPTAWKNFAPGITTVDSDALLKLYPSSGFPTTDLRTQTATGDFSIRCTRTIMATEFSKTVPTWTYRYNQQDPSVNSSLVGHSAENWMMFNGSVIGPNGSVTFNPMKPAESAFASELIAYWLSFVRTGNPNSFRLPLSPVWPPYREGDRFRNVLQQVSTYPGGSFLELEANPETERCRLTGSQTSQEN